MLDYPKPREGTETWGYGVRCPVRWHIAGLPQAPRGDGNKEVVSGAAVEAHELDYPKPREGTETRAYNRIWLRA